MAGRRAARPHGARPPHARSRRRLAGGQRGRARPAPRRGDGRRRPAAGGRRVARAGRELDPLGAAPGAAVAAEGRCRRRARHRRRHVDGGAARALRGSHPGADRAPCAEPRVGDSPAGRVLARGHRSGQPEHARRRHLRRIVRSRPEPALAPAARASRTPHARGRPLAHRSEHASRPRARRRLGNARRQGAAAADARCAAAGTETNTIRRSERAARIRDAANEARGGSRSRQGGVAARVGPADDDAAAAARRRARTSSARSASSRTSSSSPTRSASCSTSFARTRRAWIATRSRRA